MPELPEVEAARKLAHEHCAGKRITKVVCEDDETVIQDVKPAELARELQGRTVKDVHRKGKSLWFEMDDDGPWPSFHFGMTGSFTVKGVESVKYRAVAEGDPEQWPPRFHKVVISFDGGVELAFCDARRFARVRYLEDVTLKSPISDLGPDAYTELPDADSFHASLLKRRAAIKAVLLDQGFLAGIGNWVADEVLYHAGVHPESLAAELDTDAAGALRESIRMVLETAVAANADSEQYPPDWLFHHRWDTRGAKKEAPKINGHEVAFLKVGGRTSAYLPDLQKRVGGAGGSKAKAAKTRKKRSKKEEEDSDFEDFEAEPAGQFEPEPVSKPMVKESKAAVKAAARAADDKKKAASKAAEKNLPAKKRGIAKEEEAEPSESKGRVRKAVVEKAVVEKAAPAKRGRKKAEEPVLEEEPPVKKGRGKKAEVEKSVPAKKRGAEKGPGSEEEPAVADPTVDETEAAEPEEEQSVREADEGTGVSSAEKTAGDTQEETPAFEPEKVEGPVADLPPVDDEQTEEAMQEEKGSAEVEEGKKKVGAKRGRAQSSKVEAKIASEPSRKSTRNK